MCHAIGTDETKIDKFEKLFDKWKRRQEYRRKIDRKTGRKNRARSRSRSTKSDVDSASVESGGDSKLEPFDFQNPPKVLQIKPASLNLRRSGKRKKRALPHIVVKETRTSKARWYGIEMALGAN